MEREEKSAFDALECRSEVPRSEVIHEEKLFKSVNLVGGEQSWQEQMEMEDSFQMEQVKELVNTLIEEKEAVKRELSQEISKLNDQIAELLKEQKDYQIMMQKAKIDEIVKAQWKKERDEAKLQMLKLQNQLKKIEIQKEEIQVQYTNIYNQTQNFMQKEGQKGKGLEEQKSKELQRMTQKVIALKNELSEKEKMIELLSPKEKKDLAQDLLRVTEELRECTQELEASKKTIYELKENNNELLEINKVLKNRLQSHQQEEEEEKSQDKCVSVSIFSEEEAQEDLEVDYNNPRIKDFDLDKENN